MKAKTIDRNLNRKRNWKRNSSRRFMRSNYRMRWGSFDPVALGFMIDRVEANA
ncbi:hypothetical protein [Stenotrophomonas phage BUCT627]|uniref:Uncharacterized protein n=1 Tax=Stenotrophomonas phage BUCT627 TaxID=2860377 RepID=A0AC61N9V3_9CAUD|nr:hypothetical protein PQD77_gp020 [Stenotrophomonas phage BUCT627]QYC96626.1 hypothetical protein [Stenotrophomonas phage BUCT627]